MSIVAVKIKLMPKSPETDMKKLEKDAIGLLDKEKVKNAQFEIHPIAFGLKALVIMFGWPEDKELEPLESKFSKIKDVNSVEVLDIRRAIG
jgi:translation elongation factor aEF-1 beta